MRILKLIIVLLLYTAILFMTFKFNVEEKNNAYVIHLDILGQDLVYFADK